MSIDFKKWARIYKGIVPDPSTLSGGYLEYLRNEYNEAKDKIEDLSSNVSWQKVPTIKEKEEGEEKEKPKPHFEEPFPLKVDHEGIQEDQGSSRAQDNVDRLQEENHDLARGHATLSLHEQQGKVDLPPNTNLKFGLSDLTKVAVSLNSNLSFINGSVKSICGMDPSQQSSFLEDKGMKPRFNARQQLQLMQNKDAFMSGVSSHLQGVQSALGSMAGKIQEQISKVTGVIGEIEGNINQLKNMPVIGGVLSQLKSMSSMQSSMNVENQVQESVKEVEEVVDVLSELKQIFASLYSFSKILNVAELDAAFMLVNATITQIQLQQDAGADYTVAMNNLVTQFSDLKTKMDKAIDSVLMYRNSPELDIGEVVEKVTIADDKIDGVMNKIKEVLNLVEKNLSSTLSKPSSALSIINGLEGDVTSAFQNTGLNVTTSSNPVKGCYDQIGTIPTLVDSGFGINYNNPDRVMNESSPANPYEVSGLASGSTQFTMASPSSSWNSALGQALPVSTSKENRNPARFTPGVDRDFRTGPRTPEETRPKPGQTSNLLIRNVQGLKEIKDLENTTIIIDDTDLSKVTISGCVDCHFVIRSKHKDNEKGNKAAETDARDGNMVNYGPRNKTVVDTRRKQDRKENQDKQETRFTKANSITANQDCTFEFHGVEFSASGGAVTSGNKNCTFKLDDCKTNSGISMGSDTCKFEVRNASGNSSSGAFFAGDTNCEYRVDGSDLQGQGIFTGVKNSRIFTSESKLNAQQAVYQADNTQITETRVRNQAMQAIYALSNNCSMISNHTENTSMGQISASSDSRLSFGHSNNTSMGGGFTDENCQLTMNAKSVIQSQGDNFACTDSRITLDETEITSGGGANFKTKDCNVVGHNTSVTATGDNIVGQSMGSFRLVDSTLTSAGGYNFKGGNVTDLSMAGTKMYSSKGSMDVAQVRNTNVAAAENPGGDLELNGAANVMLCDDEYMNCKLKNCSITFSQCTIKGTFEAENCDIFFVHTKAQQGVKSKQGTFSLVKSEVTGDVEWECNWSIEESKVTGQMKVNGSGTANKLEASGEVEMEGTGIIYSSKASKFKLKGVWNCSNIDSPVEGEGMVMGTECNMEKMKGLGVFSGGTDPSDKDGMVLSDASSASGMYSTKDYNATIEGNMVSKIQDSSEVEVGSDYQFNAGGSVEMESAGDFTQTAATHTTKAGRIDHF